MYLHSSRNAIDQQQMGRAEDKAGRQLGVFMDLSTLEENREQARIMKVEARKNSGSRGDVKWSDYKEEKKANKKRKTSAWMYDPWYQVQRLLGLLTYSRPIVQILFYLSN